MYYRTELLGVCHFKFSQLQKVVMRYLSQGLLVKVALNGFPRILFNVAKSCILTCLLQFSNKKRVHQALFLVISA